MIAQRRNPLALMTNGYKQSICNLQNRLAACRWAVIAFTHDDWTEQNVLHVPHHANP